MALLKKKENKKKTEKASAALKPHKTAQQTVPYVAAYKNGIIESLPGVFTKTYQLTDVDFQTGSPERQEAIFASFGKFINTFGDLNPQFTVVNKPMDMDEFTRKFMMKNRGDGLNELRNEMNELTRENINRGNGIGTEKYLTISVEEENIDRATDRFNSNESFMVDIVREIGGAVIRPLDIRERLELLYRAYRPFDNESFDADFDSIVKSGASSKDVVAPSYFTVNKDTIEFDETLSQTLYLQTLPSSLTTDFVDAINSLPYAMLSSVHFEGIPRDKAIRLVRDQTVNINTTISEQQRKASRSGYSLDLISPDLAAAKEDAESLLSDLRSRDQRLFRVTMIVTVFAKNAEELAIAVKSVQMTAKASLCAFQKLSYQQEYGLAAALPLCENSLSVHKTLTTETAALFLPFSVQRVMDEGGISYGLNPVSGNVIIMDRLNQNRFKAPSGLVLGTPGSGKSFAVKKEIMSVILGSDADGFVVDPENEYHGVAKMLKGEVIRLAIGGANHINPLDLNIRIADGDDPVAMKADYIAALIEIMIGSRYGLDAAEKAIIFRCANLVYQPYIQYMAKHPELDIDREQCPTLVDFYNTLESQNGVAEARSLSLAIEPYCVGQLNLFAQKTNVDVSNRLVVYDIKDIGTSLKALALQVCMQDIWNRTIENRARNKRTWSWFDEFHLIAQSETAMRFMQQFYKRARKWGGVPTGITQNVEDLLASQEARTLINNSEYLMLLNQSPLDREQLAALKNISRQMYKFIDNVPYGRGLICAGPHIIPFEDVYDTNGKAYAALSTHPGDENTDFAHT